MTEHRLACYGSTVFISTICELDWYATFHDEWLAWCAEYEIPYDTSIGVFQTTEDQEFLIRMRWSPSK